MTTIERPGWIEVASASREIAYRIKFVFVEGIMDGFVDAFRLSALNPRCYFSAKILMIN